MLNPLSQYRQFWLIALMIFMLGAVQLVQASALHDHTKETVDCALCHAPLSDDPGTPSIPKPNFKTQGSYRFFLAQQLIPSRSPAPYQGRAPPVIIL